MDVDRGVGVFGFGLLGVFCWFGVLFGGFKWGVLI